MNTSVKDKVVSQLERYEQRSYKAKIRSVGEFGVGVALLYSSTKHGTPDWKAFDSAGGAIGIGLGVLETHTVLDNSRKAAALEGALAQDRLATGDIPHQLPEHTESGTTK